MKNTPNSFVTVQDSNPQASSDDNVNYCDGIKMENIPNKKVNESVQSQVSRIPQSSTENPDQALHHEGNNLSEDPGKRIRGPTTKKTKYKQKK